MDSSFYGYGDMLYPIGLVFPFEDNTMQEYVDSLEEPVRRAVVNRMEEFRSRSEVEEFVNNFEGENGEEHATF